MPIQLVLNKGRVPVKVFTQDIGHDVLQQLLNEDIDTVMANQTDLVDVVHTLKQVICIKG